MDKQTEKESLNGKNDFKDSLIPLDRLPALPPSIKGLTFGNIPIKYIRKDSFLPFQSLNVDATPEVFF